ncbi:MAG: asparaginase, partial [Acidaminococcaceae bacterium]|nr:asparaginase [Acidaminococcaceae bacterium]
MQQKPHVHIIATGGTIAGTAGAASATVGYKAGELTVDQLIASVPGLEDLAELSGEQLCNIDSKDMQENIWLRLAKHVSEAAARKDVDGIVITHGTDTLEETAFFLQLALNTEKPVVLTGAMRPATAISADGPMNIWQSVWVASDKKATGRGVLVVMNGQ